MTYLLRLPITRDQRDAALLSNYVNPFKSIAASCPENVRELLAKIDGKCETRIRPGARRRRFPGNQSWIPGRGMVALAPSLEVSGSKLTNQVLKMADEAQTPVEVCLVRRAKPMEHKKPRNRD